jgi:predicted RNase H-like HicB family nuclease
MVSLNYEDTSPENRAMSTSQHFAVVIQLEDNGTVSAYVPDLPGVYAAADTQGGALRGIREALEGYLEAMRNRGWALPPHLPDPAEP